MLTFQWLLACAMVMFIGCDDTDPQPSCGQEVSVLVDDPQVSTGQSTIELSGRVLLSGRGEFFPTYVTVENTSNRELRFTKVVTTEDACELKWTLISVLPLDVGDNNIVVHADTPGGTARAEVVVTRQDAGEQ